MQEMTPKICQSMELEKQYQLMDKRDDKVYWIARLKDGNCWMTQNLAFDIPDQELKSDLTDILEDWNVLTNPDNPPSPTKHDDTPNFAHTTSSVDMIQSWNPGEYFYTTPTKQQSVNCGSLGGVNCQKAGWQEYVGLSNIFNNTDSHFLSGNYYSFNAATAGKGSEVYTDGANVENSSICPKRWKLPIGGSSINAESGNFYTLFKSYGLSGLTNGSINVRTEPIYLLYSGRASENFANAGIHGFYWSSTSSTNKYIAYSTYMDGSLHPNVYNYRYYGYSVRCIARTEVNNDNVEITINNTISLDVASEVMIEKTDTNPSVAALPVSVASNQPYSVSISSTNPSLTSSTSSTTIPSVSGNLTSSTNAWGIKLSSDTNYTQITSTPTTFYTATGAEVKTIPFTIGISTSPDLSNGEYSTNITVTATQN